MLLIIDNYNSFVFNVARYCAELGHPARVVRNDALSLAEIERLAPTEIIISQGPAAPDEAGVSLEVLHCLSGKTPILGVCLGHQCIGAAFGGLIVRAREPMHGRASDHRQHRDRTVPGPPLAPDRRALSLADRGGDAGLHSQAQRYGAVGGGGGHGARACGSSDLRGAVSAQINPVGGRARDLRKLLSHGRGVAGECCGLTVDRRRAPLRLSICVTADCFWVTAHSSTSLAINGTVVFADRHIARLAGACEALGIPFARAQIARLLEMAAAEVSTGALRLTVTRGTGPRGLRPPAEPIPRTILAAWPGSPKAAWRSVAAVTASIRRNETSPTSRHKCLGYLDAVLAVSAAAEAGAEEALFLNTSGRVACAATGNLFALNGTTLKTPPPEEGALAGAVRAEVLALANEVGLTPVEAPLAPDELIAADAVFTTSSLRLIAPVVVLDGAPLAAAGLRRDRPDGAGASNSNSTSPWPLPMVSEGTF